MDAGGGLAPAREDEALQVGQRLVQLVAVALEPVHHRACDAQPLVGPAPRHREVGAEVEQLVLDARERRPQLARQVAGENDADLRVELVDDAVGDDARIELRYA